MCFKRYIVRFILLVVTTLFVVVISFVVIALSAAAFITRQRGRIKDSSTEFQANLYRRYFPTTLQNAWEHFCAQPRGVSEEKLKKEVVVSLTSYPARIQTTWLAIESLLRQEIKPNRIVLNLFEEEFPDKKLPAPIKAQIKRGLEINWCPDNLKVYLKIIPTIQKYPESVIIAVDDDVIYPSNFLKDLLTGHAKYPNSMIARAVKKIVVKEKKVLPVSQWRCSEHIWATEEMPPSYNLVGEGIGGLLIPPHILHKDFLKKELFMTLCPTNDDIWFYAMTVINSGTVAKVFKNQPHIQIDGTQKIPTALYKTNARNYGRAINEAFQQVFRHYNLGLILNVQDALTNDSPETRMSNEFTAIWEKIIGFFKKTFIRIRNDSNEVITILKEIIEYLKVALF
jgi:hypothetical protein